MKAAAPVPLVEQVARAMCGPDGIDPDYVVGGKPMWTYLTREAEVAIAVVQKVGGFSRSK